MVKGDHTVTIIAAVIGIILILNPGAVYSNLGSIFAHQSLYQLKASDNLPVDQMQTSRADLIKAIDLNPDESHLYLGVSRLDSWLGNYQMALAYLSKAVELDGKDPFSKYFPPESIIHNIQGTDNSSANWDDLIQIYTHWMGRFPDRAEGYLLCSMATAQGKHDTKGAAAYIMRGLEKNAEPNGILQYFLSTLKK